MTGQIAKLPGQSALAYASILAKNQEVKKFYPKSSITGKLFGNTLPSKLSSSHPYTSREQSPVASLSLLYTIHGSSLPQPLSLSFTRSTGEASRSIPFSPSHVLREQPPAASLSHSFTCPTEADSEEKGPSTCPTPSAHTLLRKRATHRVQDVTTVPTDKIATI